MAFSEDTMSATYQQFKMAALSIMDFPLSCYNSIAQADAITMMFQRVIWILCVVACAVKSANVYLQVLKSAAQQMNASNCWVCGKIVQDGSQGFPQYAVPLNWTWFNETHLNQAQKPNDCNGSKIMNYHIYLARLQNGFLCLNFTSINGVVTINSPNSCGTQSDSLDSNMTIHVGDSKCTYTATQCNITHFTIDSSLETRFTVAEDSQNKTRMQMWQYITFMQENCQILPGNLYYVCGRKAYKWLPMWSVGACYLAYVLPGVRVLNSPPTGHYRNLQAIGGGDDDLPESWDVSEGDRLAMIILPQYGVAKLTQMIRRFSKIMEHALNQTIDAINKLSEEERAMRLVVLQNRMALDYVLAAKGGVCGLVGDECCSFIPDEINAVEEDLDKVRKDVERLRKKESSWFNGVFDWIGEGLRNMLTTFASIICFILCCYVIIKVLCACIARCYAAGEALPVKGKYTTDP